jgi:Rrf2 family protein
VLYLAVNSSEEKKIMIKDIAEPINVPKAYIAKLLQELAKRKVISSTKGPKGGFYLSKENRKRTVVDIIDVIDGEERIHTCLLSLHQCDSTNPCALHHLVFKEKQIIEENLSKTTIAELSRHIAEGRSVLPL